MIAVDIETYDPNLGSFGDGAVRKDGNVLCVGMYDGKKGDVYAHDDPELIERLASNEDKVFHNGIYDLSWLICGLGYKVGGRWHDTMTRTTLIDEYAELNLDACCKKFKVTGKNANDTIDKWFEEHKAQYGLRGNAWHNFDTLWMTKEGRDAIINYNIQDCMATYNLFMAQEPYIKGDTAVVYDIETSLYPLILEVKRTGIKIDPVARDRFTDEIQTKLKEAEAQLKNLYGIDQTIIASPKKLTIAMNMLDIRSPVATATGGQSWSADALDLIDHPVTALIQEIKNYAALLNKYLLGSFQTAVVNGRIHCSFSPNKRDDGGTITGRFASSKPNMQNIPARDEKHGKKSYGQEMRTLFLPDEGCMLGAFDYSAIEAVLLAHYAQGSQAKWFKQQIIDGKDYHKVVMEMTGITSRDVIKRMNYGFIYGMGIKKLVSINRQLFKKLSSEAGIDMDLYGQQLYNTYHSKFPVIKDTMRWVERQTTAMGYIDGIGGRRHHKPRPELFNGRWQVPLYKMTNYLIQGSAAEILKKGLLDAYKAGLFSVLTMHLTVHDENVVSIPYNKMGTEAALELERYMAKSYSDRLSVPLQVVGEVGPNWGYWASDIWNEMKEGRFERDLKV